LAKLATPRLLAGALHLLRAALPVEDGRPRVLPPLRAAGNAVAGQRLAILSDASSWLNESLGELVLGWIRDGHSVEWVHAPGELRGGDYCFFLGCGQLVPAAIRARYRHNLVVHESALPHGKGWSPLTWQVLEGRTEIPVTLIEAAERVDSGLIYAEEIIRLAGDELVTELRARQAAATLTLCRRFVQDYPQCLAQARAQSGEESFYARRRPEDSRLEPARTLAEQFNQLRVADNDRYPAFFEHQGRRYRLAITAS
jgi:methionyl-tRNA formyltransferase